MKSFENFMEEIHRTGQLNVEDADHIETLLHILEGKKKKKKRKHAEDEEGKAPKTGHEGTDPHTGFEDPLKDYPEQDRIY